MGGACTDLVVDVERMVLSKESHCLTVMVLAGDGNKTRGASG